MKRFGALLMLGLLAGCAGETVVDVQVAGVLVPAVPDGAKAELRVRYTTCVGFNGACSKVTLATQSIESGSSSVTLDREIVAHRDVDDIREVELAVTYTDLDGECVLSPDDDVTVETDVDLVKIAYSGSFSGTGCGN